VSDNNEDHIQKCQHNSAASLYLNVTLSGGCLKVFLSDLVINKSCRL